MHSDNEMVNLRSVIEALLYMADEDSDGVEEIMQLPSIDIVFCKECTERDDDWCMYFGKMINPDDFCSYGEREGE